MYYGSFLLFLLGHWNNNGIRNNIAYKTRWYLYIHCLRLNHVKCGDGAGAYIPSDWATDRVHPEQVPVYLRATSIDRQQLTLTFTPTGNFSVFPITLTYAKTGRAWSPHKGMPARDQTQNFPAVRKHCLPLHHHGK